LIDCKESQTAHAKGIIMESLKKPPFRANHVARRFSSTGLGNKLTIDDQIEKLALVAPVAGDVWGGQHMIYCLLGV
jgi:hypothetical protein